MNNLQDKKMAINGCGDASTNNENQDNLYTRYQAALNAGFVLNTKKVQERTLYFGDLDKTANEEFIYSLFDEKTVIIKIKVFKATPDKSFAFVEFRDHVEAAKGMKKLKNLFLDFQMKIQWATQPDDPKPAEPLHKFDIFVGNLSPEYDDEALKNVFMPIGDVIKARVIYDSGTSKSKRYGFVSFSSSAAAQIAIDQMDGKQLGQRTIHTSWAMQKSLGSSFKSSNCKDSNQLAQSYEEVFNKTATGNTSVFVGNMPQDACEEEIRVAFSRFGAVLNIRHFKPLGYCFIKFDSRKNATNAILQMKGAEFKGQELYCWWGKPGVHGQKKFFDDALRANFGQQHAFKSRFGTNAKQQQTYRRIATESLEQQQYTYGDGVSGTDAEQQYLFDRFAGMNLEQQQNWQYYPQYYIDPVVQQQWQACWDHANQFVNYQEGAPQFLPGPPQY